MSLNFAYSSEIEYNAIAGDSTKRAFPAVTVTSERKSEDYRTDFMSLTSIDKDKITSIGALQISDALMTSPGLFLRDYGGLGGIKTVSLRGGTSSQSLVLIDGINLTQGRSGYFDFSLFPASMLNNIEIIHGGNSSLYGGNAITGIINLKTFELSTPDYLRFKLAYGSFGERNFAIGSSVRLSDFVFSGNADYTVSEGNYPIETLQFGKLVDIRRQNADFTNLSASAAMQYVKPNFNSSARLLVRMSDRGSPGPVLQGFVESTDARLKENDIIFYNKNIIELDGFSSVTADFYLKYNQMVYRDSNFSFIGNGSDLFFKSKEAGILVHYKLNSETVKNEVGIDYSFCDLNGNSLNKTLAGYINRQSLSAYTYSEMKITGFSPYEFLSSFSLRYQYYSDAGTKLAPSLGMIFKNKNWPVTAKLNLSYNYRPPSFNEMYYLNYGNSNLKPEKSISLNLGLDAVVFNSIILELTGFLINTKDQIISVPKSPLVWMAENYAEVLSKGLEFSLSSSLFSKSLNISYNYTLQKCTDESAQSSERGKLIIYIPMELAGFSLDYNLWKFNIGTSVQYSGWRYSLQDNSYESIMPAFYDWNAYLAYNFSIEPVSFNLRFDIKNLTDRQYSVIKNYNMPGRSFRLGLSTNI